MGHIHLWDMKILKPRKLWILVIHLKPYGQIMIILFLMKGQGNIYVLFVDMYMTQHSVIQTMEYLLVQSLKTYQLIGIVQDANKEKISLIKHNQ